MAAMAKHPSTVSGQLRAAMKAAAVSRYRIAKETGLEQSALSRFVRGKAGLDLSSVDKLAEYLGLELVAKRLDIGKDR